MRERDHVGQRHQTQAADREPLRGVGSGEKRFFQLTAYVGGVETTQRPSPHLRPRSAKQVKPGERDAACLPRGMTAAVPRCRGRGAGALAPTGFLLQPLQLAWAWAWAGSASACSVEATRVTHSGCAVRRLKSVRGGQVGQRGPASERGPALTPGGAGSEGLTGPAPPHARHGT